MGDLVPDFPDYPDYPEFPEYPEYPEYPDYPEYPEYIRKKRWGNMAVSRLFFVSLQPN